MFDLHDEKHKESCFTEDIYLFRTLSLNGMDMAEYQHQNKVMTYITRVVKILLYISALHLTILNLGGLYIYFDVVQFAFIFLLSLTFLLWYVSFSRRKKIYKLFCKIYENRYLWRIPMNNKSKLLIKALLVIDYLLLFLYPVVDLTLIHFYKYEGNLFWTFIYRMKNKNIENVLILYGCFCAFLFFVHIPVLITLTFCTMMYRCAELLKQIKRKLHLLLKKNNLNCVTHYAMSYFYILEMLRELKSVISVPLLILLLTNFLGVFIALSSMMIIKNLEIYSKFEITVSCVAGTCKLVALSLCASLIPQYMTEIRFIAEKLVDRYAKQPVKKFDDIFYLKRIERKESIYMTACDVVDYDKNLILSVFGALFTYGLLIINFEKR